MRDIVGKCLIKDASKRPSAAQLLEHKFFKASHNSLQDTNVFVFVKQDVMCPHSDFCNELARLHASCSGKFTCQRSFKAHAVLIGKASGITRWA